MNNPSFSFFLAFVVWLLIIGFFSFSLFKQNQFLEPQITIDAMMIGESNFEGNKSLENKKPADEKKDLSEKNHQNNNLKTAASQAKLVYRPLPQIPQYLRKTAFETKAIAKFYILKNGEVQKVELIEASNNPKLNFLLLNALKKWRFEESDSESTQNIEVIFEVK
jgi:hypothetical protein